MASLVGGKSNDGGNHGSKTSDTGRLLNENAEALKKLEISSTPFDAHGGDQSSKEVQKPLSDEDTTNVIRQWSKEDEVRELIDCIV